jgi:hypothetical protein
MDGLSAKRRPACYLSGFRRDAMETTFNNRRPPQSPEREHSFESTEDRTWSVQLRLVRVQPEPTITR